MYFFFFSLPTHTHIHTESTLDTAHSYAIGIFIYMCVYIYRRQHSPRGAHRLLSSAHSGRVLPRQSQHASHTLAVAAYYQSANLVQYRACETKHPASSHRNLERLRVGRQMFPNHVSTTQHQVLALFVLFPLPLMECSGASPRRSSLLPPDS